MDLKYNQILKYKNLLVKFIYYREDINKVIYEYKDDIFQTSLKNIYPVTKTEIIDFYNKKILNHKYKIKNIKNNYNDRKIKFKEKLRIVQEKNKQMKQLREQIFQYNIMEKIADDNICQVQIYKASVELRSIEKEKRNESLEIKRIISYRKSRLESILQIKKMISNYKKELNNILLQGVYINEN